MRGSFSVTKSKAMQSSIHDENINRNTELLYKKNILFSFSVLSEVWFYMMAWER
jgi:hypothetical protein